ncbi:hypothetical protein COR50_04075 [Chitinophaga caeni]|uniref:Histidine kinase domain-containing protein n=1 Tax=Chitinophaga caeni TaxID=2029983 RepID=A0A291QR50_9BACT|nr:hypothetical protein COR50_04075 [Chitinophaga caeni]
MEYYPMPVKIFRAYRWFLTVLLMVGSLLSTKAQRANLLFKKYDSENGLSSYNVPQVLQDKYGFIWIATQDGLNRFDGKSFEIYKKTFNSRTSLNQNHIKNLYLDGDSLWVATAYGGLNIIDTRNSEVIASYRCANPSNKPCQISNWIECSSGTPLGDIWFGSYEGIFIFSKKDRQFSHISINPFTHSAENFVVHTIYIDARERIWVGIDNYGLAVYDKYGKIEQLISKSDLGLPNSPVVFHAVIDLPGNRFGVATNHGVSHFSLQGNNIQLIQAFALKNMQAHCIKQGPKKQLWIGTTKGLFITDDQFNITDHYTQENAALPDNIIKDVFFDYQQNAWLSTYRGACKSENILRCFTAFSEDEKSKIKLEQVSDLLVMNDSMMLAGSYVGLWQINLNSGRIRKFSRGLKNINSPVSLLFRDDQGNHFVSTEEHLYYYDIDRQVLIPIEQKYPELRSISRYVFSSAVVVDPNTIVWGSENEDGIFTWHRDQKQVQHFIHDVNNNHSLPDNSVNALYVDKDQHLWCASDMAISKVNWNTGYCEVYYPGKAGPNSPIYFDVYDDGNKIWITTYGGGLNCYDKSTKQFTALTTDDGMASNACFNIVPASDSTLWVSTAKGLSRVNTKTHFIRNYYTTAGVHGNSFDEKSACSHNGYIYFGGIDGFTRINTNELSNNPFHNQTHITRIKYEAPGSSVDTSDLGVQAIKVPYNTTNIEISFAAINFIEPEQNRFAYRIPQLNQQQVMLGTDATVSFPTLPVGKYTLEIRSSNNEGEWSDDVRTLDITVTPPWWATWWFKVLAGLFVLFIIYQIYRYRVLQIKKQELVRRNIASDLHDDIGSSLNAVKVFTHLAKITPENNHYLEQVDESLKQATSGLRDMIWVLDDSADTIQELLNRVQKFAIPVTMAQKIQFELQVEDKALYKVISKAEKKNLLLIIKEAITNSIKYAACNKILLKIILTQKGNLCITIQDNGNGFDTSIIHEGNGLKNMLLRVKQIQYIADITSNDHGTVINICKK